VIPVEEALAIVLREAAALPTEEVSLDDALGRVLAEDAASDVEMPPFDRAAMDGYAVRSADVRSAPVALEVVGEVRAGQWPEREVGAGETLRIMTGAPLPRGADAVQQVERTRPLDEFRVVIEASVPAGANVAPRASEARSGEVVLPAGRVLDPRAIAVLAATGRARVRVGRRPRVALLVTGDELVDVGEVPGRGRIRNSNGPALAAQARRAGAVVLDLGVAGDRQDALAERLSTGLKADVLAVSGGVSAGQYDLVEPVLADLGVSFLFTQVAIKPGAPLAFGRREATLVFGLPGNPVSSQVTFALFVRAALLRLQGARVTSPPRVAVELLGPLRNRSGRRAHAPARVRLERGRLVARPLRSMGSGDLVAHARANALVVVEADRTEARAGESAEAMLLDGFLEDDGAEG
jgi:molybdopterin molybdotransferase